MQLTQTVGPPARVQLALSTADDLYGTFEGARYTAEHVPGARFVGYPSGGHMLVGRDDAATEEIVTFLRERAKY